MSAAPFGWVVSGCHDLRMGEFAESDTKSEAAHCGGTACAIPLYTEAVWMPIESAPKNGRDMLAFDGSLVRLAFWDDARGGVWSKWPGRESIDATHWMPLPAPPKAV